MKRTKRKSSAQTKVQSFSKRYKLGASLEARLLDLVSEIGELAKEVLKITKYGKKKPQVTTEIAAEIGDVFFSLLSVANGFGLSLEHELDMTIKKYKRRLRKGGTPGSESA